MAESKFKTLLFDWDGCIAHSLPAWLLAYQQVLAKYGAKISDQEIIRTLFVDWKSVLSLGIPSVEDFSAKMLLQVNDQVPFVDLHPTVLETLKKLRQTPRQHAIVTSSRRPYIEIALNLHKIQHLFDDMITYEDVIKRKPDPEPVQKIMTRLGAKKETTLIIGDSSVDVAAGKAAGITTVLYYPQSHERFYLYEDVKALKSDFLIRHFSELLEVVEKL